MHAQHDAHMQGNQYAFLCLLTHTMYAYLRCLEASLVSEHLALQAVAGWCLRHCPAAVGAAVVALPGQQPKGVQHCQLALPAGPLVHLHKSHANTAVGRGCPVLMFKAAARQATGMLATGVQQCYLARFASLKRIPCNIQTPCTLAVGLQFK